MSFWQRDSSSHVWHLPHRFIIHSSESVTQNGSVLSTPDDYRLDYVQGTVFFRRPVPAEDTLAICYRYLPLKLKTRYFLRERSPLDSSGINKAGALYVPVQKIKEGTSVYGSDLQRSGSIFRGVSIGSDQGMRLQSGLRLQISGEIARGVEIVASLTDQSTPIQPEGNTRSLQEIDKIFINVLAENFSATLGDFSVNLDDDAVGRYTRKLQGVMTSVRYRNAALNLIAAASKGEYKSMNFNGLEGNQGPYQLTGIRGQREIIVLAGTEKVYIDGERLVRGEDNDYTIEYANGQITFTRKRLITSDSRITVDFEYSDQKFQKQVYGAQSTVKLFADNFQITGTLLHETDDKDNPLDMILTDDYRRILHASGDDPDSAVTAGARYVGENEGSYQRRDSSGTTVYTYAGTGRGDYIVRFSYAGEQKGDYSFQGYGIYRYEGPQKGSYLPVIFLPMAASKHVAGISSRLNLKEKLQISGSASLSSYDKNLYSPYDDKDNSGLLWNMNMSYREPSLSAFGIQLGSIEMMSRIRKINETYVPLGRINIIEHGRKWGKPEGAGQGESLQEYTVVYQPYPKVRLSGEWGSLDQKSGFTSARNAYELAVDTNKLPKIDFLHESLTTGRTPGKEGFWQRDYGSVMLPLGKFKPAVMYKGEHQKDLAADSAFTGFKFHEWTGILDFTSSRFSASLRETVRENSTYIPASILQHESSARTDQVTCSMKLSGGLTSSLLYTHRVRTYASLPAQDKRSDLADLSLNYKSPANSILGHVQYSFSSTYSSQMVRDTIKVGEGLGNYRFDEDLNEIVPDADGDLFIRNIQTGIFLPVNHLKFSGDVKLDGSRLNPEAKKDGLFQRLAASMRSQTIVRIERQDQSNSFLAVNRAAFSSRSGRDSSVVSRLSSLRHYLEFLTMDSDLSVRMNYRADNTADHQLLYAGMIREHRETGLRVKANFSNIGLEANIADIRDHKNYDDRNRTDRKIRVKEADLQVHYRIKRNIELKCAIEVKNGTDHIPEPHIDAASIFFQPGISLEIRQKGRVRADVEIGRISVSTGQKSIPYEMFSGDQPGLTRRWNAYFSYRMGSHVMATVSYRGRDEPWRRRVFHAGQVEVRAFF